MDTLTPRKDWAVNEADRSYGETSKGIAKCPAVARKRVTNPARIIQIGECPG